jgi:taurine dioxygenase
MGAIAMDVAVNSLPETLSVLTVTPLTVRIGAEISGVDASRPVPPPMARELNALLNKWKVLFFRDQPIDPDQQVAFAETFGPINREYFISDPDHPAIQKVEPARSKYGHVDRWHSDTSWMVKPAKAALLFGKTIPPVGGDTIWADGVAAYAGLPDEVKERIEDLDVIHDAGNIGQFAKKGHPDFLNRQQANRERRRKYPLVAHPIVRSHPETGEKTLFLNAGLCTFIVGLAPGESRELLEYLYKEYTRPKYTVRFRWRTNSIAVWDQRQTMHFAVTDYPLETTDRVLHRILIAGDDVPHR